MMRRMLLAGCGLLLLVLCAPPVEGCSLCEGSVLVQSPTLRQESVLPTARFILHGTIANPSFGEKGKGATTDFLVKTPLRGDKMVKTPDKLLLSRYLPVDDPKKPPHYLLFCDLDGKKLDPYRGIALKGGLKTVEYVKKAMTLDPKKPTDALAFFFAHLDNDDPEVARDAFLEFAKAKDQDILVAAPKFSAEKLRGWLKDPKTPGGRLSVYALLLGACGKDTDAAYLRELLDSKEDRYTAAADGIMAGYMQLKPKEGWELLQSILSDGKKPLLTRIGAVRTLRFHHGANPKENKPHILKSMRAVLAQGELADLAIEDLRRWQIWDLTDDVLKRYGEKGYDAPLIKRAIIRYALCSTPTKTSTEFLKERRAKEKELVDEVDQYLKLEKNSR